ncbi:MAG: cyclic nucleotide-binding domain-containing protein, partial [Candidatus Competibacter sp.]|nr:cyclic nucleotide-binding domain-containing protein [Candidatus Competibacter sp.]
MQIYKDGPDLISLIDQFKKLPVLQSFDGEALEQVLTASTMPVYEAGETIISEGQVGDRLYVLLKGKVRVEKNNTTVAMLDQVGEIFGELSLLGQETRSASVYAEETTWCLELSPSFLQTLSQNDQGSCYAMLYLFIARVVADRLMKTTDELALTIKELENTRQNMAEKISELQLSSEEGKVITELDLVMKRLTNSSEKLSRLISYD